MGCLEEKVAIITGAGNGIGKEHALLFAQEGARVVVNDPGCDRHGEGASPVAETVAEEIRAAGGEAVANLDPVGSFESARRIVEMTLDAYGKLDVVVNNAGILRDRTLLKTSEEEWDQVLQVHLKGTFSIMQAAARQMKKQGFGGRIINTSSGSGLLGNFGQSNYGAAKMGIQALTRIGAMELAHYGITVNAIAPMAFTRMTSDLPNNRGLDPEERRQNSGPQHIAPLVVYLASDRATHITGETFGVGGTRLFLYKMMCSRGTEKRGSHDPWTQDELAGVIDRVLNF